MPCWRRARDWSYPAPVRGKNRSAPSRIRDMRTHHLTRFDRWCHDGPPADVVDWRYCRLVEAGFPQELARELSAMPDIDLHALLELVDRGCPPALAARILSPDPAP